MSKESYARGFCKVAEAAGVDPVALAKFANETSEKITAPEYDTGGYAPEVISRVGNKGIPSYHWTGKDGPSVIKTPVQLYNEAYDRFRSNHEDVRDAANPKHMEWRLAHTKAIRDALKPVLAAYGSGNLTGFKKDYRFKGLKEDGAEDEMDEETLGMLAKIYHDSMAKSTGGVSRVSVPAENAQELPQWQSARTRWPKAIKQKPQ